MNTTIQQQRKAIRMAIRGLDTEMMNLRRKEQDESTVGAMEQVREEREALEDAITALEKFHAFRGALGDLLKD